MLGALWTTAHQWRWGMMVASAIYAVWLALQINTWWIGYAVGASPAWEHIYAHFFSQTIQVFPKIGKHIPPDASHFVLQIIVFAALATTLKAAICVSNSAVLVGGRSGYQLHGR